MRYGGKTVDEHYDALLSTNQYKTMVDNIKINLMEPILQVPYDDGTHTDSVAAGLVDDLNITHGLAVKYWTIGNEPNKFYPVNNDAEKIATYFRSFASAMKSVDPSILITGPDLAWYDNSIMEDLTEPYGLDDITGSFNIDDQDHYYLDIINFHTYPFPTKIGEDGEVEYIYQTREEVIYYPITKLQPELIDLKDRVDAANAEYGRIGDDALKMAITEINVNYQNPESDGIDGVGATSFLGGQFWAEVFSLGMKWELAFITPWSTVSESLGFIDYDPVTSTKRPSYYHFQMMATNFRGSYLEATVLNSGSNDPLIKAFGAIDNDQIVVMILNQHECGDIISAVDYTVRLDGDTAGGNNPLKINLGAGVNSEYSNPNGQPLQCESTVLLIFDEYGALQRREVYSKEWHAYQDLPPSELGN
ncbi:MAG: hypothetical protein GY941_05875 [Planctomycetes bacterium]|nr:hypothetical protein [Planctomycetota bacterium]